MKHINIQQPQQNCGSLRTKAREEHSMPDWNQYRNTRNNLKSQIRKAKREFYQKALSSRKPKDVWRVIHRILHPSPQPLRGNPDELNEHFASTTQRVTGAAAESVDNLWKLIDSLPDHNDDAFSLKHVTCQKVTQELKKLRSALMAMTGFQLRLSS